MVGQEKKLGRINVETNVLPVRSKQKRQGGGGTGGGDVKEEETVGIRQGTFDLAQSFGFGCMLGSQQQVIVGTSCVRG